MRACAGVLAAALALGVPGHAVAQGPSLFERSDAPLEIEAEQGIEWHQDKKVYVARGDVHAKRGGVTLRSDTLSAFYDDLPGGGTGIVRVVAEGAVEVTSQNQAVFGDRAVYDVASRTVVMTGRNLRLTTAQDVVTARDSLEWHETGELAVARGEAVATRQNRKLRADVITATVVSAPNQPSRIARVDAHGNVVVATATEVARSAAGVYDVDKGVATLTGGVTITRGDNQLKGQTAVVDMKTGVSRLTTGTGNRVRGLINPRQGAQAPKKP